MSFVFRYFRFYITILLLDRHDVLFIHVRIEWTRFFFQI